MTAHSLPGGYLHTRGASIVGEDGNPVRLAGVNWYGFDCPSMVVGGLDHRPLDDLCGLIADLGFNTVRLPFCVELVRENPPITAYLDAEPSLAGKGALEVMDAVIAACGRHGLKVILDCHRGPAGWSTQENGLWYTATYREEAWLQSWEQVVRRFAEDAAVIGCDLHNEPGSPSPDPSAWPANGGSLWGHGDPLLGGPPRDWASAATRAGNRILAVNPNLLIFVEGVRADPAGPRENGNVYWPGGNLSGVARAALPRRLTSIRITLNVPNRLVYSAHDYGPDMYRQLPWCQSGGTASSPDACNRVWSRTWGFIAEEEIAPVLIGEFGTPNGKKPGDETPARSYTQINETNPQGSWFAYLVRYIKEHNLHWTYWCLNGTQSRAPGRDPTRPDWYGILDSTWRDVASDSLLEALESIQ
jgi:endoglucanase